MLMVQRREQDRCHLEKEKEVSSTPGRVTGLVVRTSQDLLPTFSHNLRLGQEAYLIVQGKLKVRGFWSGFPFGPLGGPHCKQLNGTMEEKQDWVYLPRTSSSCPYVIWWVGFYGPTGGKTGLVLLGSRTRRARQEKCSPTRTQKTTLGFSCRYEPSSINPQPPQTHLGLPQRPSSQFGKKKKGWNLKNSAFT